MKYESSTYYTVVLIAGNTGSQKYRLSEFIKSKGGNIIRPSGNDSLLVHMDSSLADQVRRNFDFVTNVIKQS